MAKIRSKDTRIEKMMTGSFEELGLEYARHPHLFGNPDFLIDGKVAVFCDGDFWHGYRMGTNPRLRITDNREFWIRKIRKNIARDKKVVKTLSEQGWKVMRFWEHDIRKDPRRCALAVANVIKAIRRASRERDVGKPPSDGELGYLTSSGQASYWITPVSGDELRAGEEIVKSNLGERRFHGLGRHTPGRKSLKPGDWICFYVSGKGIVAHARLASNPKLEPAISPLHPIVLYLGDVKMYLQRPTTLDFATRTGLDAFRSRTQKNWGWFVTTTHRISRHDFEFLTRQSED